MSHLRALITGITGQDGSYLAELLVAKGYEVHGTIRRADAIPRDVDGDVGRRSSRIASIQERVILHAVDLQSYRDVRRLLSEVRFDECYHLAARSFPGEGLEEGLVTMSVNTNTTQYLLAAIREEQPSCRVYFAGSSEMFGSALDSPQTENTSFRPRNPYGISKVAGYHLCRSYRESYGIFCCCGLLFNHESPRRGTEFVTRKITQAAAAIKLGMASVVRLGNLDARRDWGHAADYVRAMHLMTRLDEPADFVIATGETHSVRELAEKAFSCVGLDYREFVVTDERLARPVETHPLVGDAAKARRVLSWAPKYTFEDIVTEMVESDLTHLGPLRAERGGEWEADGAQHRSGLVLDAQRSRGRLG